MTRKHTLNASVSASLRPKRGGAFLRSLLAMILISAVFLTPVTAIAAMSKADVYKADFTLYFENGKMYKNNVAGGEISVPGWSMNGSTLCLDGFNFETTADIGLYVRSSLWSSVVVEVVNASITAGTCGIYCDGQLYLQGKGTLNVSARGNSNCDGSYAIHTVHQLAIVGCTVNATSGIVRAGGISAGLYSEANVHIARKANVTVKCASVTYNVAGNAYGILTVNDCKLWSSNVFIDSGRWVGQKSDSIGVKSKSKQIEIAMERQYGNVDMVIKGCTNAFSDVPTIGWGVCCEGTHNYVNYSGAGRYPDSSSRWNADIKWVKAWYGNPPWDPQPNSGEFLLTKLIAGKGKRVELNGILPPEYTGNPKWMIDNKSVIKIAGSGKKAQLVPLRTGSALLTADFGNGTAATISVIVIDKNKAASKLTLPGKLSVAVDGVERPKYTVGPAKAADKTLTWYTTDKTVANVDQMGAVLGVKAGNCSILAVTTAGVRRIINVTVE